MEGSPEEIGAAFQELLCDAWMAPLLGGEKNGAGSGFNATEVPMKDPLKAPLGSLGGAIDAIPGQENLLGALEIYINDRHSLRNDEEQFLRAVANIVAAAIERKRSESLLQAQTQVLELVAGGTNVTEVYDTLCRLLAEETPGAMCSIMVLNRDTHRLHMIGRSPNIPDAFVEIVDGLEPGQTAASCGTAAFRGKPVFITDAMTAAEWEPCRPVAKQFNIRACWSMPFSSQQGETLGTFAISLHLPCEPSQHHLQILKTAAHLASIATEGHQAAVRLQRQALYDTLTELPNRNFFLQTLGYEFDQVKALRQAIMSYGEADTKPDVEVPGLAVLFFDVDRFKLINDSFGHHVGDLYLQAIAKRLIHCLDSKHLLARLSGDEFAIIIRSTRWKDEAIAIATCIQQSLTAPLKVGAREVFASMSIGIAAFTEDCQRPEDLLRHADTAMYHHKLNPRTPYAIFDEAMHLKARARLQLEMDLYRATTSLEQWDMCQMQVYYQPIMNLKTGRLGGVEALLRWFHPERGAIPPDEFIPVAEETSAITHIGSWVLNQACGQLREWQQRVPYQDDLFMSINVAACQFLQADFVDCLARALKTHRLSAQNLRLEITETALMQTGGSVQQILRAIHALGVKLSLDDFGTGYSSLSYLHRLPIDTLKIDRSFISTYEGDGGRIAETILMLAKGLGLEVVAEGVETSEQWGWLRDLQCDFAQGYLFSKPLPSHQIERLLPTGQLQLLQKS
ncbi:MAG: putative bifunctional diguanylate cyclase/phosphodiesterase [Cyanophyceae cyanobacterium]